MFQLPGFDGRLKSRSDSVASLSAAGHTSATNMNSCWGEVGKSRTRKESFYREWCKSILTTGIFLCKLLVSQSLVRWKWGRGFCVTWDLLCLWPTAAAPVPHRQINPATKTYSFSVRLCTDMTHLSEPQHSGRSRRFPDSRHRPDQADAVQRCTIAQIFYFFIFLAKNNYTTVI